ncbi:MAG: multi-sensor hybrid histidine kinase [Candidatus Magnetoglobus multicellularis str. Araruama]|uniref:histidine kinase n=1 Tax=Candidatus Magnetoglobus multicellularis str. Araruama TaxID=890399 RepID=A0A1V1PFA1_9BACT|nr:MAG: multi-sensor hybrid histidine kinase [Candidatus Magnetoglobus multicellularis str. Araruama]
MFIGLGALFTCLALYFWYIILLPQIRANTTSNIKALSQAQAYRLESYIESNRDTLTPQQLRELMEKMLLLKDSYTHYQFLIGIRLEMDYETIDLAYQRGQSANLFDIAVSSFSCDDCTESELVLYSTSTRDLIGVATFTINSQFMNYLEKSIQLSFIVGSLTIVGIIILFWWIIAIMLKPFAQLAFHLEAQHSQFPKPLPKLSSPKTQEIMAVKDAMDSMLTRINKNQEILEQTVQERTIELRETIAQMKIEVETRQRAEQEAIAANKTKSQFLANMSHEIRTPLNAIIGFSELLKKDLTDNKHKNYVQTIVSSGKTLLGLINDILDLSKIEAGKLELQYSNVSLRTLLQEMSYTFSPTLTSKGLSYNIDIDPDLPEALLLDEVRIRQILFNLVGNAVKFTEQGSISVFVKKKFTEVDNSHIKLIIGVQDTGVGIPEDQVSVIFESFRQQDGQKLSEYGGTGLGLAITKRLIEMMNGKIEVISQVNKGSVFQFELPDIPVASLVQGVTEKDIFDDDYCGHVEFEPAKILVVDDVPNNQILMESFLVDFNFEILIASNGLEGVDLAQQYHPDLIFMDIKMPVMDGFEATRKIKANALTRNIPIVILSASAMKGISDELDTIEYESYLTKPVSQKAIVEALKKFIPYHGEDLSDCEETVNDDQDSQEKNVPQTDISFDIPFELLEKIRLFEPQIRVQLDEGILIDDVERIANKIKVINEAYACKPINDWTDEVLNLIDMFDVENLTESLKQFSAFIK